MNREPMKIDNGRPQSHPLFRIRFNILDMTGHSIYSDNESKSWGTRAQCENHSKRNSLMIRRI